MSCDSYDQIPGHISDSLAWYGPELGTKTDRWIVELSDQDIGELERAASAVIKKTYR